jgi:hypothetical protein
MKKLLLILLLAFGNLVNCQSSVLYKEAIKTKTNTNISYDSYEVSFFKVIDNTVDGQLSANTGLANDKNRNLLYSGTTPINSITTGIYIYNYEGIYQGQLPIVSVQGFDYHPIDDQFIVWSQGGATSSLITYAYDGTVIYTQTNFDPFGDGTGSGSVCIDYVNNKLLLSSDGVSDIAILTKSGNDWVFDSWLGATSPQEGITYDEEENNYWYNRTDVIVNISIAGVELRTIPQTSKTINVNEGLAIIPSLKLIAVNSDMGFHGSIVDGNRCVFLYYDY